MSASGSTNPIGGGAAAKRQKLADDILRGSAAPKVTDDIGGADRLELDNVLHEKQVLLNNFGTLCILALGPRVVGRRVVAELF